MSPHGMRVAIAATLWTCALTALVSLCAASMVLGAVAVWGMR